jgi:hypothetical protein
LGTDFVVHHRIVSAVKIVEFVSDRTSYTRIVLTCRWCNIIVLNVHTPNEEKSGDLKDNSYDVFDHFPKYHTKILLDLNAKLGRGGIFIPTIGKDNLQ